MSQNISRRELIRRGGVLGGLLAPTDVLTHRSNLPRKLRNHAAHDGGSQGDGRKAQDSGLRQDLDVCYR